MTNSDPIDGHQDFATAIMKKIESENITTHSRWRFVLHDVAFWCLWFLSALMGALALSASVFVFRSSSWQLYMLTHDSFLAYAISAIPFLWLLLFLIMVILAYVNWRHTPKGHRYATVSLILLNSAVTFLVAVVVTAAGLGRFVDEEVGKHVPLHVSARHQQQLDWFRPEEGLLIGQVEHVDQTEQVFSLLSPEAESIDVDGHLLTNEEWQVLKALDAHVRVIGVPQTASPFVACLILPGFPGRVAARLDYGERILLEPRSIECKGVRPYDRFHQINP